MFVFDILFWDHKYRGIANRFYGELCTQVRSIPIRPLTEIMKPRSLTEFNKLRQEALEAATRKIQSIASVAVDVLLEIASDSPNPGVRRKAALDLLRLSGFEPGSQETYGWGLGPVIEDAVKAQWGREKLYADLV